MTTEIVRQGADYVQLEQCPVCGTTQLVKLPKDWQGDLVIPIVGCGNPFHYTETSLGDSPDDAEDGAI